MSNKKKKYYKLPTCDVSYVKRFFAYLVDYYVGLLCCSFPIVMANGILNQSDHMQMNLFLFDGITFYIIGIISLVVGYWFYIYIPMFVWKGQTLGKRMFHFKMLRCDGKEITWKELWIRYFIGFTLIEESFLPSSSIVRQMLTKLTGFNFVDTFIYLGLGISIVSCIIMLFSKNRQMLHDRFANTLVVQDY